MQMATYGIQTRGVQPQGIVKYCMRKSCPSKHKKWMLDGYL